MLVRIRPRLNHTTVVAYLALFVALGGGALAATSFIGSNGQIHGCVSKNGQLRVLKPGKKCKKSETKIAWNQKGPKGDNGGTGATGPSDAFQAFPTTNVSIASMTEPGTSIVTLHNLPAGSYAIFGHTNLDFGSGPGPVHVRCYIDYDHSGPAGDAGLQQPTDRSGVSAQSVMTLTTARDVDFACSKSTAADVGTAGARLTAIKVGRMTTLNGP
jgi:hypothetical protein